MSTRTLIVLARSNSWYAPLITAITDTWFNHVFFVYEDKDFNNWMAIDILENGPVILPVERAMERYRRVECWEYDGDLWKGVKGSCQDIGGGYDWLGLFFAIIKLLAFKIFRVERLRPIHWATKYMCFEWVMTVMKRSNVPGSESLEPSIVPPAQFCNFLDRHENFFQVIPPEEVWDNERK